MKVMKRCVIRINVNNLIFPQNHVLLEIGITTFFPNLVLWRCCLDINTQEFPPVATGHFLYMICLTSHNLNKSKYRH